MAEFGYWYRLPILAKSALDVQSVYLVRLSNPTVWLLHLGS